MSKYESERTLNGRTLDDMVNEIMSYKRNDVQAQVAMGKILIDAKKLVKHGEWMDWLLDKVEMSVHMAERYMKMARSYPDPNLVVGLGITKALALTSVPDTQRARFIKARHDVYGVKKRITEMSVQEIKMAINKQLHPEKVIEYPTKSIPADEAGDRMRNNYQVADYIFDIQSDISDLLDGKLYDGALADLVKAIDISKEIINTDIYIPNKLKHHQIMLIVEIWHAIADGDYIKQCQRCGRFFGTHNHRHKYCGRVDETGHRCDEKSKKKSSINVKELNEIYNRARNTHYARIAAGRLSRDEYRKWLDEARLKRDEVLNGTYSFYEYQKWLKK